MRTDDFLARPPHDFAGVQRGVPLLSVVVPVFDEEGLIGALTDRLARVLDELGVEAEVILVDDGSGDGTFTAIARANASDARFVGVSLSRNFGHQAAITAGLSYARGGAVVVMDGDLQDPPEAIGPLWNKLNEGYDVVYAVRASRTEGYLKRLAYLGFYRMLSRLVSFNIPLDAGDFGIMSRKVVDLLNAMPERRRFVRGLRAWVGFRQTGIPIDRSPRFSGKPKFTLGKLVSLAFDGLIGFSEAPLRWLAGLGLIVTGASLMALALGWSRVAFGRGMPSALFSMGGLLGASAGAQLLFVGVLGEYLSRILQEVTGRPIYIVRKRIGIGTPERNRTARRVRSQTRSR